MSLNIRLVKVTGATMNSRYSNRISNYNVDTKHLLSTGDLGFSQFLRESYVFVKKEIKKLEEMEQDMLNLQTN